MPYADPDREREAAKMRGRKYRERHPTASRDAQRRRRAKRPKECEALQTKWRKSNPERVARNNWAAFLKSRYRITPAEYEEMFTAQGGKCAICEEPPGDTRLAVDHDHQTGANRGLLCTKCNAGLAMLTDTPWKFRASLRYLAKHKRRQVMTATKNEGGET